MDENNLLNNQQFDTQAFYESIQPPIQLKVQEHFENLTKPIIPNIPNRAEEIARELQTQTEELQRLNDENARINQQLESAHITMKRQLHEMETHKQDKVELVKQNRHLKEIADNTKKQGIIGYLLGIFSAVIAEIIVLIIVRIFTVQ